MLSVFGKEAALLIKSDHLPATPSCLTIARETREAILALLGNDSCHLPKTVLASILDRFRHDGAVHSALIHRSALPPEIVERLLRLVACRRELDILLVRHVKGRVSANDLRVTRPRPRWWKIGLFAGMA